jgi:hypothetical protein
VQTQREHDYQGLVLFMHLVKRILTLIVLSQQPGILTPGKNYRFKWTNGSILVDLGCPCLISSFTLIHPLKTEMPFGYFNSAHKTFSVYVSFIL